MEIDISPIRVEKMQCLICNFSSTLSRKILQHYENHGITCIEYFCPKCPESYPTKPEIDLHFLIHHYDSCLKYVTSFFYECIYCDFKHILKTVVLDHIKNQIPQNSFECYHCSDVFDNKLDLCEHVETHSTDTNFSYQCSNCKNCYTAKSSYDEHIVKNTHNCQEENMKYVTICTGH